MKLKYLLSLLLLCHLPLSALAKDQITWANLHFPPWMILEGESKGQGVWDELLNELVSKLPEYEHTFSTMNNARYDRQSANQEKICKVYYFKTPQREKILYYSDPSVVFLTNKIVMNRKKAEELGNPTSYSLDKLMQSHNFELSLIHDRSYGKVIDQLIATHSGQEHIEIQSMANKNLFKFFARDRTDYIIEFPAIRSFFEKDLQIETDAVNISIEEAVLYNVTYVTCVKNEWGKKVIDRINVILKDYIQTKRHREATLRWYNPTQRQQLSKIYDEVLVK